MKNYFGPRLAKRTCERTCGREQRAFAGRSCGPLRPFQDRNSKLVAVSKGKPAAAVCYRVCGVELGPSGPAARSRSRAEGCNSRLAGPLVQAHPLGCGSASQAGAMPSGIGGPHLPMLCAVYSTSKRSAGRSLRPAEARSSRPAGPLRARPPQAASRVCCDNLCAVCGIGPSGPAARSRPLAEGCSSTSQARPLGCELALRLKSTSKRSAGRSLRPAEARSSFPNLACSPQAAPRACQFAANRRQPATRVPQVRFERALRRLCPVLAKKRPFPKRRKARPGVPSRQRTASSLQMQKRPLPKERPFE